MSSGSSSTSNAITQQQQEQQIALQTGGQNIENAYKGFDSNFYKGVSKNVEQQQLPQLGTQYRNQVKNLDYKMADQGLLRSSATNEARTDLGTALATGQQQVVDTGTAA